MDIQCKQSGEMCRSPPGICCMYVYSTIFFHVIWIIDWMCKWQELCTRITHRDAARRARPDLLTYTHMRMMDTHVVTVVDIHAQLIIHELHCAWISPIFSETDRGVGTPGCTGEIFGIRSLACICVWKWSVTPHSRWFIFTVYICAVQVTVFWCAPDHWDSFCVGCCGCRPVNRRMREGMRDVRWRERGTEQRFSCRLCHFLLREGDPWDPPSLENGQNVHTRTQICAHCSVGGKPAEQ